MIKKLCSPGSRLLILGIGLYLAGTGSTSAQLPYSQSFMTNSAPGLVLGGSPVAFLTAGQTVSYPASGTVTDPVNGGYLRLTSNSTGSGGYVYNNTPFPAANGLKVSFEYFAYAGSNPPADGFSFFLFDGATTNFNIGSYGGALGYENAGVQPGVSNGYLGIGLDVYGNYTGQGQNHVGIRGPGNGNAGYALLTTSGYVTPTLYSNSQMRAPNPTDGGYRKVIIEFAPKVVTGGYSYDITVKIVSGSAGGAVTNTVISNYTGFSTVAPAYLKYGFAGSTGSLSEVHEIRNLNVEAYTLPTGTPTTSDDAATLNCNATSVNIPVLNNDVPANAPLAFDSTSVRFINPNNPNDTGLSYSIPGVGTFSSSNAYGSHGLVTFTPEYLFAGTATIRYVVKDNYGIGSNASTITVDGSSRIGTYAVVTTMATCNGATNGSVRINTSTNPSGYTYAMGAGGYTSSGAFTGLGAGTYTFHTMNGSGCTKDTTITITQPAAATATLSGTTSMCNGNTATLTFSGTPNSTVTYTDGTNTSTTGLGAAGTTTVTVTPATPTIYTATSVAVASGCSYALSNQHAVITVYPLPVLGFTSTDPFCHGQSTGVIAANVSGGSPGYSFLWTPGGATTPSLLGIPAGSYALTVTDQNGCQASGSRSLAEPAILSAAITPGYSVPACNNYNVYLGYGAQSISLAAAPSGGTAPYSYTWTPTAGMSNTHVAAPTVTPSATTTYSLALTDAHGCGTTATSVVKVLNIHCGPAYIGRELNKNITICHGGISACVSPTTAAGYVSGGDCPGPCITAVKGIANNEDVELSMDGTITLYPNPAHSTVNVKLAGLGNYYKAYQVVDLSGRVVARQSAGEGAVAAELSIDVSRMVPGIYLLRVVGEGDTIANARFSVE